MAAVGCFLTQNLKDLACTFTVAGVSRILLIEWENVVSVTKVNEQVTVITLVDDTFFYEVLADFNAGFTQEYAVSGSNRYFTHSVQFTIPYYDLVTMSEMENLFKGNKAMALVQKKDGKWILLGEFSGMKATAGSAGSGINEGDEAGISITLSGANTGMAPLVAPGIVPALIFVAP